jgi:hypothetical protein
MTSRPSTAAPILAVLAVVLVMLGAYVGGYFWLGECHDVDDAFGRYVPTRIRLYDHRWQARFFYPVGWLEAKVGGKSVHLFTKERETTAA